jgi:hypothetical protein
MTMKKRIRGDYVINKFLQLFKNKPTITETMGHCATNLTVAGSIPDGVIGSFH